MTTTVTIAHPIQRYDGVARGLHWLMAALIIAAFSLGLLVDAFPPSWEDGVVNMHKLIGISILCLVVVRLIWRAGHRPPLPEPTGALLERISSITHILLYVLMIAVPIIGLGFAVWNGQGLDFGFFSIAPLMAEDETVAGQIGEIHELAAYLLIGLAGLHALAALWHAYVRKDTVLQRMLSPK